MSIISCTVLIQYVLVLVLAARANGSHRTFSFTLAQFGRHGRQWKVSHKKIHKEKMRLPRQNYREKENHDRENESNQ